MISFKATQEERLFVDSIVTRVLLEKLAPGRTYKDIEMDLLATHANGCPLDFEKLHNFDEFNFAHDIKGIERNLCRKTGKLTNHFFPRCANTSAVKSALRAALPRRAKKSKKP